MDISGIRRESRREYNALCFLEKCAQRSPDRPALLWPASAVPDTDDAIPALHHASVSFRELFEASGRIAAGLGAAGIVPGDRVIIFLPMSVHLYMAMFAVLRIGAVAVFLDAWATKSHLAACAERVRPSAVISHAALFSFADAAPALLSVPLKVAADKGEHPYQDLASLAAGVGERDIAPVLNETPALITFTTGSSGTPKGAVRTHAFLAAQHRALSACIPFRDDDRDLTTFPIFSLNSLASGITAVLPASGVASSAEQDSRIMVAQIISAGATTCTVSPHILDAMAAYCRRHSLKLPGLRRIVTGGAPVSRETLRLAGDIAPGASVLVLYGSTEAEPISCIRADEMPPEEDLETGVCVGRIVEGLRCRFIRIQHGPVELGNSGWSGIEASSGEVGELVVSGPHVCGDYYHDPEAFRSTKIRDLDGTVWHRTGDLGLLDQNGLLWITGRVHTVITRAGQHLFPVAAELAMKTLPFVRQAAYVGMPDAALGEKACAAISLARELAPEKPAEYAGAVRSILQKNGMPVDDIRILDEIPMDPRHHSKVQYSRLKEMLG